MTVRFVDELDGVLGWTEDAGVRRTSHALGAGGRMWVVDPIDGKGVEERILALGEPAGVIQLLDRHERDCADFATRLGVPLHVVPAALPGSPFELLPVVGSRFWREVALWWPERRILVCADVLGTVPHYFRVRDEPVGIHPLLRLAPPRILRGLNPEHVLVGHGEAAHDVGAALDDSLRHSRRRIPAWIAGLPKLRRV
jgi:hypothetical protein